MDVDQGASAPFRPALPALDPSGSVDRVTPARAPSQGLPPGCALRPMEPEDLPFVIAEHQAHFPDGFFARLGPRYLTAYTRTYLTSEHARAYVAEAYGTPVGFLVGVIDPAAHREHVLRIHSRGLAVRACAALCARPHLALHFTRTRLGRYGRKLLLGRLEHGVAATGAPHDGITAVLSHVAVTPRVRSLGLGSALIRLFTEDAEVEGCARISLVTKAGESGAGPYYERLGWRGTGEMRTPEGIAYTTYEYQFSQGPAQ